MTKFTAKVVIDYDDVLGIEPGVSITQAKRNEMMRDMVFIQVTDALKQYGLRAETLEVRKTQNG